MSSVTGVSTVDEVPSTDCNAPLRGVPTWLATAKVNFTCTNCPKRPSRAARFEPVAAEPRALLAEAPEAELEEVEIEDLDEETELELGADDLDEPKTDKE